MVGSGSAHCAGSALLIAPGSGSNRVLNVGGAVDAGSRAGSGAATCSGSAIVLPF